MVATKPTAQESAGEITSAKLLNTNRVMAVTGLSRTSIARLEKAGKFPKRVSIFSGRNYWLAEEIEQWLASLAH